MMGGKRGDGKGRGNRIGGKSWDGRGRGNGRVREQMGG